jgi:hypothetical protein
MHEVLCAVLLTRRIIYYAPAADFLTGEVIQADNALALFAKQRTT